MRSCRNTLCSCCPALRISPELDCIGHLTYYARQNPYPDRQLRYRNAPDELDALFMYLISHGKGLEINTSSKTPYGFSCRMRISCAVTMNWAARS